MGIPSELAELIILRPLSGNGSLATLDTLIAEHGADSYIARSAAVHHVCGRNRLLRSRRLFQYGQGKENALHYPDIPFCEHAWRNRCLCTL